MNLFGRELSEDDLCSLFIYKLEEFNGKATNDKLISALCWPEGVFYNIKNILINEKEIIIGRGRGGNIVFPEKQLKSNVVSGVVKKSFEQDLFSISDKLRKNIDPSQYKYIVLGLIFIKYVSDHTKVDIWNNIVKNYNDKNIGNIIYNSIIEIQNVESAYKDLVVNNYNDQSIDIDMLSGLIKIISRIKTDESDIFGRIYEYFISEFANSEGKRGGEFYTPKSIVKLMVEIISPVEGSLYDPCCGTGGMFIESEKLTRNIEVFGQESNINTWKLAKMNLLVHECNSELKWNNEGTLLSDEFFDKKFDYILANPPFNVSDWGRDRLREDARWVYGVPPVGNANYAWLQHILWHLAPNGTAGVVLANGSMSSGQSGEDVIRRAMVEADVVDCMVALPGQLFYSTQIPACLWFLARSKKPGGNLRDRRGEVLFIDARKLGTLVDRTRRELSDEDISKIASTYHAWRGEKDVGTYADMSGFCKAATLEEIRGHNHVLTPGRYVGAADVEDDEVPFGERFAALKANLEEQFSSAERLTALIRRKLSEIAIDG